MEGQPGTSNINTPKKNPPGKFVGSGRKKIIINLYKDLIRDQPNLKYKEMIKELSRVSGVGLLTISKTITEYKRTGCVTSPNKKKIRLSVAEKTTEEAESAIRKKVHDLWFKDEIPNLNKILHAVNEDPALPSFSRTTLHRLLKAMDFKFTARSRNSALMEKEHIVLWRQKYIERIKQYRQEGRHIYYLDETCINTGDLKRKIWKDNTVICSVDAHKRCIPVGTSNKSMGKGKQLIVTHIGSTDGFVPGGLLCLEPNKNSDDYQNGMTGDTFFEWFHGILPMLKDNSVIVMDNAPYHSVTLDVYPTMMWKKSQIIAWLVAKGVNIPPKFVKVRLMTLVDTLKPPHPKYIVDEYAKQNNKIVLRLPPYHCELNPIELAWATVIGIANNSSCSMVDVKRLILESIENVSAELWQDFIHRTQQEEDRLQQFDHVTDELMDLSNPESACLTDSRSGSGSDSELP